MAASSGLFLATIYNQSQLAERKHIAHYWLINTVATAVPLSVHTSTLVITTKLAAAILVVLLFRGGALPASTTPVGISGLVQAMLEAVDGSRLGAFSVQVVPLRDCSGKKNFCMQLWTPRCTWTCMGGYIYTVSQKNIPDLVRELTC